MPPLTTSALRTACYTCLVIFLLTGPESFVVSQDSATESGDKTTAQKAADNGPVAGHSSHGEIFNEGPRQQAYLMGTTGNIDFPVTSSVSNVREFINQGVGQLHGFWYFEAERSFRQAAALDPDCAFA